MFRKANQLDWVSRGVALHPSDTVDTNGAARILGISASSLAKMRAFRPDESPPFLRLGRTIHYRVGDLHAWQEQRLTGGSALRLSARPASAPRQDQE